MITISKFIYLIKQKPLWQLLIMFILILMHRLYSNSPWLIHIYILTTDFILIKLYKVKYFSPIDTTLMR